MSEINNIHDAFFKKTFSNVNNARDFLKFVLPENLKNCINLNSIKIDASGYVSENIKEYFSDIVIKTSLKHQKREPDPPPADIYILFEHKSYKDKKIFIQLLKYMYLMWQKDSNENRPLRLILPLVFYHGKGEWNIPLEFNKVFDAPAELQEFMLNFRYVLFDAGRCGGIESNPAVKNNIFLLTSLLLLKNAFEENINGIEKIFDFWKEQGFIKTPKDEKLVFFITYIVNTHDIKEEALEDLLEKKAIKGGDIMPTLAQRWEESGFKKGVVEGIEQGIEKGVEKGLKEGELKGKLEDAKIMHKKGFSLEDIMDITGLTRKKLTEAGIR